MIKKEGEGQGESNTDLSSASSVKVSHGPIEEFFGAPPDWLTAQLKKCRENERFVKPTCSSVAYEVFQTASRWEEVEPVLRRRLEGGDL